MGEISIAGRSGRYGNKIMSVQDDDDDINVETGTMLASAILQKDIPEIHSTADTKLSWLRYQTIGQVAEIDTPFGKRQLTYADHTASGRCLQYVEDYIIQNVFPFYGNTHTSDSYVGEHTGKIYHEATEFIKKCLGGAQDDALFFCGSGTTAAIKRLQEVMGIAISSILKEKVLNSCLKIEERWVVFVGPYEHHSNVLSWRQSLAEVIEIGLDDEGLIDINSLKRQLQIYQRTGRPMLGSFSACSNVTGIVSDTRSISSLLHLFGAFACFDFAASGPYVEIDMRSGAIDGYDAVFLSPHKFLGGPGTPGVLLINKALYQLKNSPPSTCGGGTVNYVNYFNEKDTLYVNDIEEREDAGTPQIIQRVKAALAFQVKEYIGYKVIADKEHEYTTRALERLGKNRNIWVLGNTKVERQAIISFLVYTTKSSSGVERVDDKVDERINIPKYEARYKRDKPLDGAFVAKLLNDLFGIQSRGGCACAGPYGHYLLGIGDRLSLEMRSAIEKGYNGAKSGWTRVSFPYYMSNEEFEFILSALEFIATYGQRFLPFYEFNWITGSWTFKSNVFEEKFKKEKGCKLCASFSTNPSKELKAKDKNRRSCMHMGLAMYAYDYAKQVKDNYWSTPKSTNDHIHMQAMYAFYLEVARHVGNVLPKYPAGSTIPEGVNPNYVFFRV